MSLGGKVSIVFGVGHEVQPLPFVGRSRAVCANNSRPAGVAFSFHVCKYTVEPTVSNCRLNLFAKACCRAALLNKTEPDGPQVALVGLAALLPGLAEGLARA